MISHDNPRFADPECHPSGDCGPCVPAPSIFDTDVFECATCNRKGWELRPGADCWVNECERDLPGAMLAPNAQWVCSAPCRSQLMFNHADVRTQSLLRRYHLALAELAEISCTDLGALLDEWNCGGELACSPLSDALEGIAAASFRRGERAPAWIVDNIPPAERMATAITKAITGLEFGVMDALALCVDFELRMAKVGLGSKNAAVTGEWIGSALFRIARQMRALAAARDGKEAVDLAGDPGSTVEIHRCANNQGDGYFGAVGGAA